MKTIQVTHSSLGVTVGEAPKGRSSTSQHITVEEAKKLVAALQAAIKAAR